ncbi:MAG: ABC transporter ATP-binding protein [Desulfovibrionaceae bacterium]
MSLLYEVHNLERRYGERVALRLNAFCVERGHIVALTGPNGAGKSTLLRLLAFLEQPDAGTIEFWGTAQATPRHEATLLLQEPYLLKRSVLENVAYGLRVRGDTQNESERVSEALEQVGFKPEPILHRQWWALSGGEKQRVALAARLIVRPLALLLDEPTASVDTRSARAIHAAVNRAAREGTTVIVASHDNTWLNTLCAESLCLQPAQVDENV